MKGIAMSAALDVDQLRTFVAIAELGSFTRAADAVHKTQSAVSMQMRRLEERVGRPIFFRDGRHSRLTEDGSRLLEYARRMIRLNDETMQAFSCDVLDGQIRMGIPDDYTDRLLPRVLASFARIHPRVEIAVACHDSGVVGEKIRSGELDIGIVTSDDCSDLGQVIRQERIHWVASADHAPEEIDPLPLAVAPAPCNWRAAVFAAIEGMNRDCRVAYTSSSASALSGAVLAGLAVTILPESALRSGMRTLGKREGFPELPRCHISLIRSDRATGAIHDALACHVVASLGNMGVEAAA